MADNQEEFDTSGIVSETFDDGKPVEDEKTSVPPVEDEKTSVPPVDEEESGDEHGAEEAEAEDDSEVGDDSEDGESEDDDESDDSEETERRRNKKSARDRINELVRAREEERRRAEELEQRLAQLEAKTAPKKDDDGEAAEDDGEEPSERKRVTEVKTEDGKTLKRPDPADYEFGEVDTQYLEDVTTFNVELSLAQRREREEKTRQEQAARQQAEEARKKWIELSKQGVEKYDDYAEVVLQGAKEGSYPLSETLGLLIADSEVGADVAYHLASNPEEAVHVDSLSPTQQAAYFGRLEAKYLESSADEKDGSTRKTESKLPPPPRHKTRGKGGKFKASWASDDIRSIEARAKDEGLL